MAVPFKKLYDSLVQYIDEEKAKRFVRTSIEDSFSDINSSAIDFKKEIPAYLSLGD